MSAMPALSLAIETVRAPANDGGEVLSSALSSVIAAHVERYLANLGTALDSTNDVYDRFLAELERPLLAGVLQASKGNQLKTARVLGINRNTLRKKLTVHGLI